MARHRYAFVMLSGFLILATTNRAVAQANPPKVLLRIGSSSLGHSDRLDHVSFSADGKTLATAASYTDESICVWDLATGNRLFRQKLDLRKDWSGIAISADGKRLAALVRGIDWEANVELYVWDMVTQKELLVLPFGTWRLSRRANIEFSPDGNTLAVGGVGLRLVDLTNGKIRSNFAEEDNVYCIAFHPGGKVVAMSGKDIQFWDVETGKNRGRLKIPTSTAVAFSPDGNTLAFFAGGTVRACKVSLPNDASKPVELSRERKLGKIQLMEAYLAFSADSKKLLASGSFDCREFEVATGKLLHDWSRPNEHVYGLSYCDRHPIAVTKLYEATAVQLWDIETNKEVLGGRGHLKGISALAFGPDDVLISAADDLRIWNARTGKQLVRADSEGSIYKLQIMPGGKEVAAVGSIVNWFGLRDGKKLYTYDPLPIAQAYPLELFANGRTLAVPVVEIKVSKKSASGQETHCRGASFVDLETRREVVRLTAIDQPHFCISPDGSTLAAYDYGVTFWSLRTGAKLYSSHDKSWPTEVTFSSDGKFAAFRQSLAITIWNVSKRRPVREWKLSQSEPTDGLRHVRSNLAFSPDGRFLAIGTPKGSVQLWDKNTGECVADVRGHSSSVSALAFRPDGRALASGSTDRTIAIWDLGDFQPPRKGTSDWKKGTQKE